MPESQNSLVSELTDEQGSKFSLSIQKDDPQEMTRGG